MPSKLLRNEYISKITNALNRSVSASRLEHRGLEGRVREIFAEELLKPILYPGTEIGTGKIIDSVGSVSAETDLVIYSRNTLPPYVYGHDVGVYPIESCIYAIEVKSTLTAQEIKSSISKIAQLRKLKHLYSFYPLNFVQPYGPPYTTTIPILFAFSSDLSPTGKNEIDRYRENDPAANTSPSFPVICVAGRGYWRFETKRQNPSWLFHPPTTEHDEIIDFISGVSNTIPEQVWMRGHPRYGNYISLERPEQEC